MVRKTRYRPRRSKYNNRKTPVDGHMFDSKAEALRYHELKVLLGAGKISDLELQVPFPLHAAGGGLVGKYLADFQYFDLELGDWVVEDVKGSRRTMTDLYRWKKKHVQHEYCVQIREVFR